MPVRLYLIIACLLPVSLAAQTLAGLSTRWGDSFTEWRILTTEEEVEGELVQIWQGQNDWNEWRYRLGESAGTIKLKWPNNPNQWEARGNNQIVTARTLYHNNFREWRVTDGTHTVTLRCRYQNLFDEWLLQSERHGWFEMYTLYEGDPRDWAIVDEMQENIPLSMRMMLSFLVVFHSTPKM